MADFPVCPSSERTMSVLPPFCRGAIKTGRFYHKVVSANLFADTLPNSKDCTAQSLSRFATAPFTQGSPWRVHPRTIKRYRAAQGKNDYTYFTHDSAPALRANKIPAAWQRVLCNKKEERKMKKTFD